MFRLVLLLLVITLPPSKFLPRTNRHCLPQMKDILKTEEFVVPAGVTVDLKSRIINVEGPRGKLTKNVRHVNMDIQLVRGTTFALGRSAVEETVGLTDTSLVVCCALLVVCLVWLGWVDLVCGVAFLAGLGLDVSQYQKKGANTITLSVWHGGRKHLACLRTIRSLIENMIKGVTVVRPFLPSCPPSPASFRFRQPSDSLPLIPFLLVCLGIWWGLYGQTGIPVQDEGRLRPFPHQLHHR